MDNNTYYIGHRGSSGGYGTGTGSGRTPDSGTPSGKDIDVNNRLDKQEKVSNEVIQVHGLDVADKPTNTPSSTDNNSSGGRIIDKTPIDSKLEVSKAENSLSLSNSGKTPAQSGRNDVEPNTEEMSGKPVAVEGRINNIGVNKDNETGKQPIGVSGRVDNSSLSRVK